MSTQLVTSIESRTFVTKLDKVLFTTTDDTVDITVEADGLTLLSETYTPDASGKVTLWDLCSLLTPYLKETLVSPVKITYTSVGNDDPLESNFIAIYTSAFIEQSSADFIAGHFLTHLTEKTTAIGRIERLYLYHNASIVNARCTAHYSDGTENVTYLPYNYMTDYDRIYPVDCSPAQFVITGKTLTDYTIAYNDRTMRFILEPPREIGVSVAFINSFGCAETLYCSGTHELEPEYERKAAYVEGNYINVSIDETKKFKAYTGTLTTAMSNWADDLFRSPSVRILQQNGNLGREITITDAKAVRKNDDDYLPDFYFEYRFAQRNNNIIDSAQSWRIFDDSFDYSFN